MSQIGASNKPKWLRRFRGKEVTKDMRTIVLAVRDLSAIEYSRRYGLSPVEFAASLDLLILAGEMEFFADGENIGLRPTDSLKATGKFIRDALEASASEDEATDILRQSIASLRRSLDIAGARAMAQ